VLTLFSPSKVNLFLQVRGSRPDGYHELASLFQAMSLGDRISYSLADNDSIKLSSKNIPNFPLDHTNLIFKSADLFRKKTGLKFGLNVLLDKNVPLQAGLGGGSGNAATTLWAVNELHGRPLTENELIELSKEVGSDVTFFFSQGTAFCKGRGEIVENLPALSIDSNCFVIKPMQGLSTPLVFKEFKKNDALEVNQEEVIKGFYNNKPFLFNDLEKPAFRLDHSLKACKEYLQSLGFDFVVMSGSGTSFFCIGNPLRPVDPWLKVYLVKFISRKKDAWYDLIE
jgi:4-diphosphocytidyl-2-C-methyl-D-erythritol kinase